MCHGRIAPKSNSAFVVTSVGHGVFLQLVILSTLLGDGLTSGVTREFLGTKSPSWWMGSRLHYLHTRKLCMAVLVTACHRLTLEYRSFCRKGLHLVGGMCQGSSSCRARVPVPLQVERMRPLAILGYVKPGVPRAQRL